MAYKANRSGQLQGDVNQTEALEHTGVGGATVAGSGTTDWIYPGDAISILVSSTGTTKMQMRGGGGDGLGATTYRNLQPSTGVNNPTSTTSGVARFNIIPHEFRFLDTTGSENKITWTLFY